ncbi:hypothetical protein OPQ81_004394 [Rhizoctonia solani]|nr:hypothetical protein OPQ81_004394 [Rhizoctonia solani]
MRLSTRGKSDTIRMEDVTPLTTVRPWRSVLLGSTLVKKKEKKEFNAFAQPDPPSLSEPPLSAKSSGNSDSEDDPSPSLTSHTFITHKDAVDPDTGVDRARPFTPSSVQPSAHAPGSRSPEISTKITGPLEPNPSDMAATSILEIPRINLEPEFDSKPFLWTPSLSLDSESVTHSDPSLSSEQSSIGIIYQTGNGPPVFLASPADRMPGIRPPHLTMAPPRLPPLPTLACDPPSHLPALRSPTLRSTPRLDQNEEWDTASRVKRNELGGAYLVKQRQWARMTITYASSLAEPQSLPPCRPVDKYIAWNSSSTPSVSSPRKRSLGALGRRVHIGPRMLPHGDWDPERRGGVIDHWNSRETLRRERVKPYGEVEQEPKRKLKPIVPLKIDTSRDCRKGGGPECEIYRKVEDEDDTTEKRQDAMYLCVKDGKRVLSGALTSAPGSDSDPHSQSENSGNPVSSTTSSSLVGDPNTMRWCVKNGVRVSSRARTPVADPNSKLEASPSARAPKPAHGETSVAPGCSEATFSFNQRRFDAECPYAPKKRSPLSEALSVGKARRFAFMMF